MSIPKPDSLVPGVADRQLVTSHWSQ